MTDNIDVIQPINLSNLAPNTYSIIFARQPKFTYNIQRVDLPGVTLSGAQVFAGPMSREDFTVPGEKLVYDPLALGIIMDEDMVAYENLFNWCNSCIVSKGIGRLPGEPLKDMTDATLIMRTNKFNSNVRFIFEDIFPIQLSAMSFDYSQGPDSVLMFDVTLNFRRFRMERVKPLTIQDL